jgi:hypothetical protein
VIEKTESKRIKADIRRVLMAVWDPIGVRDVPQVQDEYDGYIDGVYDFLIDRSSDHDIETHLWRIGAETIGMSGATKSHMTDTVSALRQISLSAKSK